MIVRAWGGKAPVEHADCFYQHLVETGVADYRRHSGCVQVQLWRRDSDGWAYFQLSSIWVSMEAIRHYAGDFPEQAVLYPGDDAFCLIPDKQVTHFDVLDILQPMHRLNAHHEERL